MLPTQIILKTIFFLFQIENKSVNFSPSILGIPTNEEEEKNGNPRKQFIRKGEVGSYKDELSEDQIRQLDEWIVKNVSDPELQKLFTSL